jgi:hypothetical protein
LGSRWPRCSARSACPVQQRRWPATRYDLSPRPFGRSRATLYSATR